MKQFVVNLLGGAGCGKSTTAMIITGLLKTQGYNVEYAEETVKDAVFEHNPYPFSDQLYILACQNKKIKERLNDKKVQAVITDSPLLLSLIYNNSYDKTFETFCLNHFQSHNNINILLKRNPNLSYKATGRIHRKNQSLKMDKKIKNLLINTNTLYHEVPINDKTPALCLQIVKEILDAQKSNPTL